MNLGVNEFDARHNSLNLIRLAFATMVIFSHAYILGGYSGERAILGNTISGWAVMGFFCVSGYLVTGSRCNSSAPLFLMQRVGRMFPGYIVCNLITVVVFAPVALVLATGRIAGYLSTQPSPASYVFANLNPAFVIGQYGIGDTLAGVPYPNVWSGSHWTLYYEFMCCLVIGVLLSLAPRWRTVGVAAAWVLTTGASLIEPTLQSRYSAGALFQGFAQLMPFFLGGSLAYLLKDRLPFRWYIALSSAVVIIALTGFSPVTGWNGTGLIAPLYTYTILWISSAFPLGKLGTLTRKYDASYGTYIYGFAVQQLVSVLIIHGYITKPPLSVDILIVTVVSVGLGLLSWRFVEQPAINAVKAMRPKLTSAGQEPTSESTESAGPVDATDSPASDDSAAPAEVSASVSLP
ncbi:MAG: acyltransferase [Propionibacteriaceae bacterium]|jgi:peptidoglycan/LPS O-acetylase OafA/YrhL|nr:acyltransferase [Propionibacteriaceae bacterium]